MLKKLRDFKEERNQLNSLKLMDNNEQDRTVKLIKNEVIDMADRVDAMQVSI